MLFKRRWDHLIEEVVMFFIRKKSRLTSLLAALLLVGVQTFAPIAAIVPKAAALSGADIDQWANSSPASWQNGDLNSNNSSYREGDSVAFRVKFSSLSLSTHSVTIQWDTTKGGKHAYDYVTSYNRTESADPCIGVTGCGSPSTYAIPTDSNVTVPQAAGNFTLFNGTINSVSGYTLTGSYAGDSSTQITINFTANNSTPVLAWGGHIAAESDWGIGNGASAVNGAPYHQRVLNMDGAPGTGNQDRSLQASAVILLPYITITKVVQSGTALPSDFSFTINPAVNGTATYGIPYGQNSVTIFNVTPDGNYTITESGPTGYGFVSGTGSNCTFSSSTATASVAQGTYGKVKNASCTFTNALQTGTITLIKNVINNNGGTAGANDFGLTIGGTAVTSGQTLTLPTGSYAINEAGLSGYAFVSITGTGCPAALDGTVSLTNSANITCTITNDDIAPSLTLVKTVTNDNGGTAQPTDWILTATGPTSISGAGGVTSGTTFKAGTYTLSESGSTTGYAPSAWNCVGGTQNGSSITLGLGGSATCTINNDDQSPSLTLVKQVSNTHGGKAVPTDWTLTATGPTTISGAGGTSSDSSFKAGTYTLSESGAPTGYTASAWSCTNGVTVTNSQITLANGQATTCTITNSDIAPTLTVIKNVFNPYGTRAAVSSFPLFVDGTQVTSGTSYTTFDAGSYTISETSNVSGYTFTGVSGDCTYDTQTNIISIILSLGQSSTCTLTNTAVQPQLIVKKHVVNLYNGSKSASDFTMTVTGNSPSQSSFAGSETGTTVNLNEGSYSVDELSHVGYTESLSADCSGTIAVGDVKTCTVTNTEIAPALTVVKDVTNSFGGSHKASDFKLYVNGALLTNPVSSNNDQTATYTYPSPLSNTAYAVSEDTSTGYAQDSLNCTDDSTQATVSNPVTLSEGQHVTCVITNSDKPASLTIIKDASPANGQTFYFTSDQLGSFSLIGDDSANSQRTFNNLSAGSYTITEQSTPNWNTVIMLCENGDRWVEVNGDNPWTVSLKLGDNVTCTVYNAEQNGITGSKFEDVNGNGNWDQGEPGLAGWTIQLYQDCFDGEESCGSTLIATTQTDQTGAYSFGQLDTGDYTVCEVQQAGWMQTYPSDNNGCHSFSIEGDGQTVINVDFGNFKKGEVQGVKFNDENGNGKRDAGEPTLRNWQITLTKECTINAGNLTNAITCQNTLAGTATTDTNGAYSFANLVPGTYKVCEVMQDKWAQTYPGTTDGCTEFTIATSGQIVTTDFGNKPKPQVLGELVNTGADASTNIIVGIALLGALGAVHFLSLRRKDYSR